MAKTSRNPVALGSKRGEARELVFATLIQHLCIFSSLMNQNFYVCRYFVFILCTFFVNINNIHIDNEYHKNSLMLWIVQL